MSAGVDPPAPPYRASHLGADKVSEYDRDFWTDGTVKAQNWAIERTLLARVFDTVLPAPPQRALDFACGSGRVLAELERRVPHTVGVDISPDMLALARQRCPRSQFVCADVTDPAAPGPDLGEPFDVVTSFRFLLNAEPQLRQAALRFLHGRLAPRGRLVVNFHLNPNSLRGVYLRARWRGARRVSMLSPGEIGRLLAAAGFAIEDVRGYEYLPFRREGRTLAAPRVRARIERALSTRTSLRPLAACHLVVARAR